MAAKLDIIRTLPAEAEPAAVSFFKAGPEIQGLCLDENRGDFDIQVLSAGIIRSTALVSGQPEISGRVKGQRDAERPVSQDDQSRAFTAGGEAWSDFDGSCKSGRSQLLHKQLRCVIQRPAVPWKRSGIQPQAAAGDQAMPTGSGVGLPLPLQAERSPAEII
ncbi:hypothetical protein D3C73_881470 [compost metagenome]